MLIRDGAADTTDPPNLTVVGANDAKLGLVRPSRRGDVPVEGLLHLREVIGVDPRAKLIAAQRGIAGQPENAVDFV